MDIYRFINSKDIREYLRDIDYTFTVPERAFLIYMSHTTTLQEKFEAWKEIVNTMPDCSMESRFNMMEIHSFHQFLADYMKLEQRMMNMFYETENAVYTYEIYEKDISSNISCDSKYDWCKSEIFFGDFQQSYLHFRKNYAKKNFKKVRFIKYILVTSGEGNGKQLMIEMNSGLDILSVDCRGLLNSSELDTILAFEGMCFQFPTPFRRGDILVNRRWPDSPIVLDYINTWNSGEFLDNGFHKDDPLVKQADKRLERNRKFADTSDMNYYAYAVQESEAGVFHIDYDVYQNYLDLERYTESLEGKQKILKAVSGTIIPEADKRISIELLCDASQLIFMEEQCERQRKYITSFYTKEGQELAGLVDIGNDKELSSE